jgi:hypothetical protein
MVEESAEDLTDGGRYGIERSSRRSSPLRHVTSDAVARLLWFGGGRETNRCESRRRTTLLRRRLSIFRALYGPVGSGRLGWAGPGQYVWSVQPRPRRPRVPAGIAAPISRRPPSLRRGG